MSYSTKQIDKAFARAVHISIKDHNSMVIISDCHRGCGTWADNFLPNRHLYTAALKYYLSKDFTYIELGDGDELWENRRFSDIYNTHSEIFSIFTEFAKKEKLFLLYGNHDRIMKKDGRLEALVVDTDERPLFMLHGYQGDLINDDFWKISRWLVRYLWKPLELRGFKNPTSAAKNVTKLRKTESRFMTYSCNRNCILICGHTHRPTISEKSCGTYLNCGSCVHPNAITAIEIHGGSVKLVKWSVCSDSDMHLFVCREILNGPILLYQMSEYL